MPRLTDQAPGFEPHRLKRKVYAGFAAALLVLCLVGWMSYRSLNELLKASRQTAHTHEVLTSSERLFSHLKEAQAMRRGFAITSDSSFNAPFATATQNVELELAKLERLTLDHNASVMIGAELAPAVTQVIKQLREAYKAQMQGGLSTEQEIDYTLAGSSLMAQATRALQNFQQVEMELLEKRRAETTSQSHVTYGIIGAAIVLTLLLVGFATFFINQDVDKRARIQHELTLAHDTLEQRVEERTHELTETNEMLAKEVQTRIQAEEKTRQQVRHLAALRAIDIAITSAMDTRVTLSVILDQLTTELKLDACAIMLVEEESTYLKFATGRGFNTDLVPTSTLELEEGIAAGISSGQKMYAICNLTAPDLDPARPGLHEKEGFVCYFAAPMFGKGQFLGILEGFHRTPIEPDQEWRNFFEALAGQTAIALDNSRLFHQLASAHFNLRLSYDRTIEGWSRALDLRDNETEGHSNRVTEATEHLARKMKLPSSEIVHMRRGALLHDIGKMGVPDTILLKPGPLTPEEWVIMKTHPELAHKLLSPIAYLAQAMDIPYCHHEKWDGTGYPRSLKGEQIPLSARIFAICDVYDALRSDRPYREGWPHDKVMEYVRAQDGLHFDPHVVEAFLTMEAEGTMQG